MSNEPMGADAYDLGKYFMRGAHELSNAVVFQDSNIPLRDHSGLYGGGRDVEPHSSREVEYEAPELEHDEPELDR